MSIITILVIGMIVASLTPKGQAFLSTDKGAATFVAVSGLVIVSMIPGLLAGSFLNLAFIGLWGYMGYQRLPQARVFARRKFKSISRS